MATNDIRQWLDIGPDFAFVTTLYSDKLHLRHKAIAGDAVLCGRTFPLAGISNYPANAMPVEELCGSCVRSYRLHERKGEGA